MNLYATAPNIVTPTIRLPSIIARQATAATAAPSGQRAGEPLPGHGSLSLAERPLHGQAVPFSWREALTEGELGPEGPHQHIGEDHARAYYGVGEYGRGGGYGRQTIDRGLLVGEAAASCHESVPGGGASSDGGRVAGLAEAAAHERRRHMSETRRLTARAAIPLGGEGGASGSEEFRAWFLVRAAGAREREEAWLRSLEHVQAFIQQQGPFAGVLGFSQGATLAALLCTNSMAAGMQLHPRAALLCAGQVSTSHPDSEALASGIVDGVQSLHVIGRGDQVTPPGRSRELLQVFERARPGTTSEVRKVSCCSQGAIGAEEGVWMICTPKELERGAVARLRSSTGSASTSTAAYSVHLLH
eukprot:jgi/Mesen1/1644/ME000135S00631